MMDPEKVVVYCPTRGEVWHQTADRLAFTGIMAGVGLPIYRRETASISSCRNAIVAEFLEDDNEVLVMVDDDVVPPDHYLQMLDWLDEGYDVVSGVCLIARPGTVFLPNIFHKTKEGSYEVRLGADPGQSIVEVDAVGSGCIAISRRLLSNPHLKAPFTPLYDKRGVLETGEDLRFCERARSQGYKVGADFTVFCEHHQASYMNSIALAYSQALATYVGEPDPSPEADTTEPEETENEV